MALKYFIQTFGCPSYAQIRFEVYILANEGRFGRAEENLAFVNSSQILMKGGEINEKIIN